MMIKIETERLIIRDWNLDDADFLFNLLSKEVNQEGNAGDRIKTKEEAKECIEWYWEMGGYKVICLKNKTPIGLWSYLNVSYDSNVPKDKQYEFGITIDKEYWGQGYAKEVSEAFIDYLVKEKEAKILWMRAYDFNQNSIRVIEKCHFQYQFQVERILKHKEDRIVQHLHYNKVY